MNRFLTCVLPLSCVCVLPACGEDFDQFSFGDAGSADSGSGSSQDAALDARDSNTADADTGDADTGAADTGGADTGDADMDGGRDGDWVSVSAGGAHTCALQPDATLWCWGHNKWGQLGHDAGIGTDDANVTPGQVGAGTEWASVAAGTHHACALKTDGTLWCWGRNRRGQLGHDTGAGTDDANVVPEQVGTDSDWLSVVASEDHTCGLREPGTLWCWGRNRRGQLGHDAGLGTDDANATPGQIGVDNDWLSVAPGTSHTCGVRQPGSLWCWGRNRRGQLGHDAGVGTDDANVSPGRVGTNTDWAAVIAGAVHTCGLAQNGSLWCWGENRRGQLGHSAGVGTTDTNVTPGQVGSDMDWLSVAARAEHTCGRRDPGTLWCWGRNRRGQLGHDAGVGTDDANAAPGQVGTGTDWFSVTAGGEHTCARMQTGTLWCWGRNRRGQLGQGVITSDANATPGPVLPP